MIVMGSKKHFLTHVWLLSWLTLGDSMWQNRLVIINYEWFYVFADLNLFSFPKTGGFIKVQIHTMALRTGCSPVVTGTVIIPKYRTYTDPQESCTVIDKCIVKTTPNVTIKTHTLGWLARWIFQISYIQYFFQKTTLF